MYILFITSSGRCDIYIHTYKYIYIYIYFAQFNNNSNKKKFQTHGFNPTQPNPCGLGWTYVMGWVG